MASSKLARRSRTKGAVAARAVADVARGLGFAGAHRTEPMQAGSGTAIYGDVGGIPLLWVESKHVKSARVGAWAREYLDTERPGVVPVIVWRDGGIGAERARATLLWTDLLKLVRELVLRRAAQYPPGACLRCGAPVMDHSLDGMELLCPVLVLPGVP